jgi:NAD(P)-dependent dehydrogenase (short-subunit alcohol dehydrogenase family)
MDVCAVCTDAAAARLLHAAGFAVVLLGPPGPELGRLAAALRASRATPFAVFAGDASDPADLAAASEMAREQFRAACVVVSSPDGARALIAFSAHGG